MGVIGPPFGGEDSSKKTDDHDRGGEKIPYNRSIDPVRAAVAALMPGRRTQNSANKIPNIPKIKRW
jgi:hypothetical protein